MDLENEVDEKNTKLAELERELDAVDKEFEDKQAVHNQMVSALQNVSFIIYKTLGKLKVSS